MGKIAIVTDSTADLPPAVLEEYNINLIPLQVHLGEEKYLDWIEIEPEEFLQRIETIDGMPSTSQPPLGNFIELYRDLAKTYDKIVSLHFSEELSGTVETARMAARMVDEIEIEVIDSRLVTGPLGELVVEVAKAAQAGAGLEEINSLIKEFKARINIYFTLDNFDYLEAGGRIGKASAFLGNLFNVRPILTLEEGEITPCKKVRGDKRLYRDISRLTGKHLASDQGQRLVILYGKYRDKAEKLKATLTDDYSWQEVEMRQFGPIVGTHVGPTPFGAVIIN